MKIEKQPRLGWILGAFSVALAALVAAYISLFVLLSGPDFVPGCEDSASDYCHALAQEPQP